MGFWQLKLAVKVLKAGGVIAYPTESVYGLGCDATNMKAVSRLLDIKNRSFEKGLIVLVSDFSQALPLIGHLNQNQIDFIHRPTERATTWLIEKSAMVSPLVAGSHKQLAVRITTHPIAKQLCQMFGKAIISTSCNRQAKSPLTNATSVRNMMIQDVDHIVGGRCGRQSPSKIVDLETGRIIRH